MTHTALFIIVGFIWGTIGTCSFIYWWTKDYNFKFGPEFIIAFMCSFIGPLAFPIGWMIHGNHGVWKILIRKR